MKYNLKEWHSNIIAQSWTYLDHLYVILQAVGLYQLVLDGHGHLCGGGHRQQAHHDPVRVLLQVGGTLEHPAPHPPRVSRSLKHLHQGLG